MREMSEKGFWIDPEGFVKKYGSAVILETEEEEEE
jgi:hypothetical protein